MRDFLRGTLGILLQVVLTILGIGLLGLSCLGGSSGGGIILIILGILCFCAVGGIRYWLGHIARIR